MTAIGNHNDDNDKCDKQQAIGNNNDYNNNTTTTQKNQIWLKVLSLVSIFEAQKTLCWVRWVIMGDEVVGQASVVGKGYEMAIARGKGGHNIL